MKNKQILAVIAAVAITATLVASNNLASIVAQQEPPQQIPSSPCPKLGEVQHWDKIIFEIRKDRSGIIPAEFIETPLDLKLPDRPGIVVNLRQEIINTLADQFKVDPENLAELGIKVIDVKYETVTCTSQEGATGSINTYTVTSDLVGIADGTIGSAEASCNSGDKLLGGGFEAGSGDKVFRSRPLVPPDQTWSASAFADDGVSSIRAFAVCATSP